MIIISMLPVVTTQSSPTNGMNTDKKSSPTKTTRAASSKIPVCTEKAVHGTGDCNRPLSTPGKLIF